MNIEVWSDVACPFCYIGKRHLEKAIEQLGMQKEVSITWKSFQLDPSAALTTDKSIYELLATKYGRDIQWAKEMNQNIIKTAAEVGLAYDIDGIKPTNSFDSHRLIHLAKSEGKQDEMKEALLAAYFVEGKHTGDKKTLAEIAASVGLNAKRVEEVLNSNEFEEAVHADIAQAQQYGISGVPFFVINKKYGISGAQPIPHFVETLNKIRSEEAETESVNK